MEALFVVAKVMRSPGKNDRLLFHSKFFKCDHDLCKILSVLTIITVLLCLATRK